MSGIKARYKDASTKVRMNGRERERKAFNVKVGVRVARFTVIQRK